MLIWIRNKNQRFWTSDRNTRHNVLRTLAKFGKPSAKHLSKMSKFSCLFPNPYEHRSENLKFGVKVEFQLSLYCLFGEQLLRFFEMFKRLGMFEHQNVWRTLLSSVASAMNLSSVLQTRSQRSSVIFNEFRRRGHIWITLNPLSWRITTGWGQTDFLLMCSLCSICFTTLCCLCSTNSVTSV